MSWRTVDRFSVKSPEPKLGSISLTLSHTWFVTYAVGAEPVIVMRPPSSWAFRFVTPRSLARIKTGPYLSVSCDIFVHLFYRDFSFQRTTNRCPHRLKLQLMCTKLESAGSKGAWVRQVGVRESQVPGSDSSLLPEIRSGLLM